MEFVINVPRAGMEDTVMTCAKSFPPEVDEFLEAGLVACFFSPENGMNFRVAIAAASDPHPSEYDQVVEQPHPSWI